VALKSASHNIVDLTPDQEGNHPLLALHRKMALSMGARPGQAILPYEAIDIALLLDRTDMTGSDQPHPIFLDAVWGGI